MMNKNNILLFDLGFPMGFIVIKFRKICLLFILNKIFYDLLNSEDFTFTIYLDTIV